jgi:ribosome recycling factor
MSPDELLLDAEERMQKALDKLKGDLSGIRTGRANPGMVDSLRVDAYGSPTPLKQLAGVSAPEPQQLVIRPFDPSIIKEIEKAIVASDLGLAPQSDGKVVRLNIPALSGDVRKKMVARTKDLTEETRVSVRNVRRDANKALDALESSGELGKDLHEQYKNDVQELTKKYEAQAGDLAKAKETEVMQG